MMKSLYHDTATTQWCYSPEAHHINNEATDYARRVLEHFTEAGYSPREIVGLLHASIEEAATEYILQARAK